MSHTCKNVLVRCMDFRLNNSFNDWLGEKGYMGDADEISCAGSCKKFVEEPKSPVSEFLFSQIKLSYELHGARKIILTQHEDCGAYGGQSAFASRKEEKAKLVSDMKELKRMLKERFNDLEVLMVWIGKKGNGWQFEEMAG